MSQPNKRMPGSAAQAPGYRAGGQAEQISADKLDKVSIHEDGFDNDYSNDESLEYSQSIKKGALSPALAAGSKPGAASAGLLTKMSADKKAERVK